MIDSIRDESPIYIGKLNYIFMVKFLSVTLLLSAVPIVVIILIGDPFSDPNSIRMYSAIYVIQLIIAAPVFMLFFFITIRACAIIVRSILFHGYAIKVIGKNIYAVSRIFGSIMVLPETKSISKYVYNREYIELISGYGSKILIPSKYFSASSEDVVSLISNTISSINMQSHQFN